MNGKKVNWMFLSIILVEFTASFGLSFLGNRFSLGIIGSIIFSELVLVLPALVFLLGTGTSLKEILAFRKIKISSALMTVLFVFLSMPLITTINAFSMLFTDNAVAKMSPDIVSMPFIVMLFMMGVFGPICEELVFRGVAHSGYRRNCNAFQAMMVSALLFGLIHMNFNQALYAFVIGIALVLLKEVTDSILAPVIYHVVFNSNSVIMLFLSERMLKSVQAAEMVNDRTTLIMTISSTLLIAVATTAVAACVLVWIAGNEGRKNYLIEIWTRRKEGRGKIVTVPFVIGVILCLAFMILLSIL